MQTYISCISFNNKNCYILGSESRLDCFNYEVSFAGVAINSISGISSAIKCQEACLAQPTCDIFEYLTTSSTCTFKGIADIVQVVPFTNAVLGPPKCMQYGK